MKHGILRIFTALFFFAFIAPAFSYRVQYKEQFYRLFHVHYAQFPDDVIENIYWLEKASKADFCHPQNALAKIENKDDWEKYRYLFMMHVNLKLAEQHLRLSRIWNKRSVRFFDTPWKEEYLRNFAKAESVVQASQPYWNEAKMWAEKASAAKFRFLTLTSIQGWEDECSMIGDGSLDYGKTISRELRLLAENTEKMAALGDDDYKAVSP